MTNECKVCKRSTSAMSLFCDDCVYLEPKQTALMSLLYWETLSPIFHDLEFTGLDAGAQIIEAYFCCKFEGSLFYAKFSPSTEMTPIAKYLTKIDDSDLVQEQPISYYWSEIHGLVNGKVLVSWGSDVDERLLREVGEELNTPLIDTYFLDLQPVYSKVRGLRGRGDFIKKSLTKASEAEGIVVDESHTARADVLMLMKIYDILLKEAKCISQIEVSPNPSLDVQSPFAVLKHINF